MARQDILYFASPRRSPWFKATVDFDAFQNTFSLQRMIQIFQTGREDNRLEVTGSELIAGHETWIIQQTNYEGKLESRYWLDKEVGFPLRVQQYVRWQFPRGDEGPPRPSQPYREIQAEARVLAFEPGVKFPEDLFDPRLPWRGGFARNADGEPADRSPNRIPWEAYNPESPLPAQAVSSLLDLSSRPLVFQYNQMVNPTAAIMPADIFAGEAFLGTFELGNPWMMACARSPDGQKIALVSQPGRSSSQNATLYWLDFSEISRGRGVQQSFSGVKVTHFAFSPDSRRLVVFGYPSMEGPGSVYLLDLTNDATGILMDLEMVSSLVWSPDGRQLALVGREAGSRYGQNALIVDTSTGKVSRRYPLNDARAGMPVDWPTQEWSVQFPVGMGGLEACAEPPKPEG
jgi:hypothetical protein